uniref:Serine/threonine-protein kinase PRP4 homolog n=1 Tax=Nelumbo nucifera TaxID=4432 RepID=A0A822YL94_NELNU|nr:TPA_asm: hypothetical protein HUJ06_010606 [Nelumbo nucifera]
MAGDEADTRKKHRRSPDDGAEEGAKRRKHSHRHHHSSSHHRHHHRHRRSKSDLGSKHEEEIALPVSVVSGSNSRPDDEKEEGEILEEEEEGYGVGDVAVVKEKTNSGVESGEIEPGEVAGGSDNRDREDHAEGDTASGKGQEKPELNRNVLTENSVGKNAQSSKTSKEYNVDDTTLDLAGDRREEIGNQLHERSDRKDIKNAPARAGGSRDSRIGHLASGQEYGEAEINGSSSESEALKSREKKHIGSSSSDDMLLHANGDISQKFPGEDYMSPLKGTRKEKDYRDAKETASRRCTRSRSPVAGEDMGSRKNRKRDDQGAKTDSIRDELSKPLELIDSDKIGTEHRRRSKSPESMKYRNNRYYDEVHSRNRLRSPEHARERRSQSRSVLQEKNKNDSDHEIVVRYSREDMHSSRDWVRDRGRERSSSYSRYSEREDKHGSRDTRERDRDRDRDRNSERERERERGRDKDRSRETEFDRVSRHNYDGPKDDYGSRDRHKDSKHPKYDEPERRERTRTKDAKKAPNSMNNVSEGHEENLQRDDDEEENYEDKVALQLAEQEEEDIDRIKEESRKRRQAILEKYKQQHLQQQVESHSQIVDKEEKNSSNVDVPKEQPCSSKAAVSAGLEVVEGRKETSDFYAVGVPFSVGKSPPQNGALDHQRTSGVGGLGDGSPKSERSNDMFCDDIFGESPAGVRKPGKGDGLQIERSGLHDNWDDAEGYYSYRFGEILDGRYEITAAHGKGVFSTVVRAKDLKAGRGDPEEVAIKIIRNNETMYKAGMEELVILKKLAGADPEDRRHCVRFLSSFKYRNHLCLVFESLHMNLREVLKKFGRNIGLKLTAVRAYAKQLFIALKHLRNCGVLHCDIKPDNMLVNEAKNVLKLCDFGNAMFAGKNEITPYLVSRFYRAPEIILGLPYDHPMDIWSVGCCLYELYTGKVLFPGPSNNDMLRLHMELKGPFPKKMLRKGAFTDQHFDQDLNFHATEEDPVTKKAVKRLLLNIKPKDIGSLITSSPGEDPKMLANFKDLLERIFILDPEKRMTVSQALSHPFITGK